MGVSVAAGSAAAVLAGMQALGGMAALLLRRRPRRRRPPRFMFALAVLAFCIAESSCGVVLELLFCADKTRSAPMRTNETANTNSRTISFPLLFLLTFVSPLHALPGSPR
jgi:hypothetical protein